MLLVLVEQVADGEVVEREPHLSDDTGLSPSQREFDLVVALLGQVPVDVHRSVLIVGFDFGIYLFRIEVSHGRNLTYRAHDGLFREQVTGLGAQLAPHDVLV